MKNVSLQADSLPTGQEHKDQKARLEIQGSYVKLRIYT